MVPNRGTHEAGQASSLPRTALSSRTGSRLPLDRRRRRKHSPSERFHQRLEVLPLAAGRGAFLLQLLKPLLQLPALLFLLPVLLQQGIDRVLPGRKLFV